MSIAYTVARLLLGFAFVAAAVSDVYFTNNPPPVPPGLAATFQDVFFRSHWVLFVGAMQLFSGALLLANRFVPLALTIAGGPLNPKTALDLSDCGMGTCVVQNDHRI
jgi:hypothetical protein